MVVGLRWSLIAPISRRLNVIQEISKFNAYCNNSEGSEMKTARIHHNHLQEGE